MSILIKQGIIYDGSGSLPYRGDILIHGSRVACIRSTIHTKAHLTIDASHSFVTPGFIDVASTFDRNFSFFSASSQIEYIHQGITSVIGGTCDVSLIPFRSDLLPYFREWGYLPPIQLTWERYFDFFRYLTRERKLLLNFGSMIGYSSVRRFVMKDVLRDPTDLEMKALQKMIARALADGVFGVSFGLSSSVEPVASRKEVEQLAHLLSRYKRTLAVHLRSYEEEVFLSIQGLFHDIQEAGASVHVYHLQPTLHHEEFYKNLLSFFSQNPAEYDFHYDCTFALSRMYPMSYLLPEEYMGVCYNPEIIHLLTHAHVKKRLLQHFKTLPLSRITIHRLDPIFHFFEGKDIAYIARTYHVLPQDMLYRIMLLTKCMGTIVLSDVHRELLQEYSLSPFSMISSNQASTHPIEGVTRSSHIHFLRWACQAEKCPPEKAISKLTSFPAKKFRIKERGFIREGYFADLVILKDYIPQDVLVNGVPVLKKGVPSVDILPGTPLRPASD